MHDLATKEDLKAALRLTELRMALMLGGMVIALTLAVFIGLLPR